MRMKECACGKLIKPQSKACRACHTKLKSRSGDVEMYRASMVQPWLSRPWLKPAKMQKKPAKM